MPGEEVLDFDEIRERGGAAFLEQPAPVNILDDDDEDRWSEILELPDEDVPPDDDMIDIVEIDRPAAMLDDEETFSDIQEIEPIAVADAEMSDIEEVSGQEFAGRRASNPLRLSDDDDDGDDAVHRPHRPTKRPRLAAASQKS